MVVDMPDDSAALGLQQFEDFGFMRAQHVEHLRRRRVLGFEHQRGAVDPKLSAGGAGYPDDVEGAHSTALPVQTGLSSLSGVNGFASALSRPSAVASLLRKPLALGGGRLELVNSCKSLGIDVVFGIFQLVIRFRRHELKIPGLPWFLEPITSSRVGTGGEGR